MDFNLLEASHNLSQLDLKLEIDNILINVLWFRVMMNKNNWIIKRHKHSSYEFHFIALGKCNVKLDEKGFKVEKGDFYITSPGTYHEQINIDKGEHIEYCINCDIKVLENNAQTEAEYILNVLQKAQCQKWEDKFGALNYFYTALEEAYYKRIGYYNTIKGLTILIISSAIRAITENISYKYTIPLKQGKNDYRFLEIKKFINDNIENTILVSDIANYFYLSQKQVSRIVKNSAGISTKELIDNIKFQKAKEMLINTNLSIKKIADTLGFSSEYYFSQFIKKREGCPPGEYRKNIKDVYKY